MTATQWDDISRLLSLLSREDHEKWFRDLIAYGQAFVLATPEGGARYLSPAGRGVARARCFTEKEWRRDGR